MKVKLRHKQKDEHQSVIDSTAGTLKNFSVDGNKVRADFHILKSLPADTREKIFEMAEVMPDQFGFSIAFCGVSEEIDGKKFARCEDLLSIDLSDNPAANPDGLFDSKEKDDEKEKADKDKKKNSDDKSKSMSAPTNEELALSISKLTELVKQLSENKPAPVTSLSYKGADGNLIQLSGEDIATQLSAAAKLSADAAANTEKSLRNSILEKMSLEGRVPMNPSSKKAYTLSELQALPIQTLEFAALNSPVVPLEAKAIYRGEEKPKVIDPNLKGSNRVLAAWDSKYSSLEQMRLENPIN